MERQRDKHSRIVVWLKVALPLLALVILSTLFLVARKIDPTMAIPYAEVDVADRIREPRMTGAAYSGVTSDGAALSISAEEAKPASDSTAPSAKGLAASLTTPDGRVTQFSAGGVTMDSAKADLTGGVTVTTPTQYQIVTDSLTMALDKTAVQSGGAVAATGPLGQIDAGAMQIAQQDGSYVLLFSNHVKLIYTPSN